MVEKMIQLLLTATIIGLALHFWLRPQTAEGFCDDDCLGPSAAAASDAAAVAEDEAWIASWSQLDQVARHGNSCRITAEKPGPAPNIRLQTVVKSCESGLPHTGDGDRIRIPDSIPEADRAPVINHELIHIWQRRHPELWSDFYRRQWGFDLFQRHNPPPSLPAEIKRIRRSNPDTWREPWARWYGRWWPVAVYTHPEAPRIRDSHTVWYDEYTNKISDRPPAEWQQFFGPCSQDEHPHEMSAVWLSHPDGPQTATEAGRRLANWWILTKNKLN